MTNGRIPEMLSVMVSSPRIHTVAQNRNPARPVPLRGAADTLSRVPFPIISRSNCANESRMFNIRRPSELVVLKSCVAETKLPPCRSNTEINRPKFDSDRLSRPTLYTATLDLP